jgi:tetratricopeptide (TPR) repeat protein
MILEGDQEMKTPKTIWLLWGMLCLAPWLAGASTADTLWATYIGEGEKAYQQGNYAEAEKQYVAALREAERFGPGDRRLATTLSSLGRLYRNQDRYAEAEPL